MKEDTKVAQDRYRRGGNVGGSYGGRGLSSGGGSNFGRSASNSSLSGSTASASGTQSRVTVTTSKPTPNVAASSGDLSALKAGEKVSHGKWGIGVVVSVKGSGNDTELQIAFPAPVGVKRLLAGFAPITKVEE